ncbi:MAG: hypothetical protein GFGODING_01269 [Flavobacteriales bacterium]|nr:hypothetical protein [Flavobacteriales bacterium]
MIVVDPMVIWLPLAGPLCQSTAVQMSEYTGSSQVTAAPQRPGRAITLMFDGQGPRVGGVSSTTRTMNAQEPVLPSASVAV